MKLIVVSDVHGRYDRLSALLCMHRDADALIFLGDGLSDLTKADAYSRGMSVIAVRGNCDVFSFFGEDAPEELCQSLGDFRFLMLHGHTKNVKSSLDAAIAAAVGRNADILLYGHTHIPLEKYMPEGSEYAFGALEKPLRIFNPGSLGASGDGKGYFGLIEIRDNGILMSHGKV